MRIDKFNWGPGIFIIGYHIALFIALPVYLIYLNPGIKIILISLSLLFLSGLSISAGYHRFYAHRAYNVSRVPETILLFFSTMALQGSVLYWAYEHRKHHMYTDKDEDPHSIKKGFLYAHMLWIFRKPSPIDGKIVNDLTKNNLVMFQHKNYLLLAIITNVIAVFFAWFITKDFAGALVFAFLARLFLLHHFTWFINSLAHTWGSKTFSGEQSAVDNYIIALLTFGEGYHNYHHVFASDYRNGVKWYHFDPSKWLVWILNKLGMANDLKKVSPYVIKRTIIIEDKKILLEKLSETNPKDKSALEIKVGEISEKIISKINQLNAIMHEYSKSRESSLKKQVREFRIGLNNSWEEWKSLSKQIMRLPST